MMARSIQGGSGVVLVVDVGNSVTNLGLACEGALSSAWSVTTPDRLTADEALLCVTSFLRVRGYDAQVRDAIVASVVPGLTDAWVEALSALCGIRPLVVGPGLKSGLKLHLNSPADSALIVWPIAWLQSSCMDSRLSSLTSGPQPRLRSSTMRASCRVGLSLRACVWLPVRWRTPLPSSLSSAAYAPDHHRQIHTRCHAGGYRHRRSRPYRRPDPSRLGRTWLRNARCRHRR